MNKEFSIKVPDELYLATYSANTWATWTYDGPETLNVIVCNNSTVIRFTEDEPTGAEPDDNTTEYVVSVDANTYPSVAHYLYTFKDEYEYVYEDEINHDGSIYTKITNPRIQDYYELTHQFGAINSREDATTVGPWRFVPRAVDTSTVAEIETRASVEMLKSKLGTLKLEAADQALYDEYILDAEEYLEVMEDVYPWKYVTITSPETPKVPIALLKLIKELNL